MEESKDSDPPAGSEIGRETGKRWTSEVVKHLGTGELQKALYYLNLCLDEEFRKNNLKETDENGSLKGEAGNGIVKSTTDVLDSEFASLSQEDLGFSPADEIGLYEKRCLIHMKLKHFDEVLSDARRILDAKVDHSLAYKCLLVTLCRMIRLEQVNEILKLWQSYSPKDLDMMECRTKLAALTLAVKNGIDATAAFSNVEDLLGMTYDWLMARKPQDPDWKFRSVPPGQNSFVLCIQSRFGHCSLGDKCPDAHGESELEEWKSRCAIKSITTLLDNIKLDSGTMYIRKLLEKLEELGDSKSLLTDGTIEGVKIKCSTPLEATVQFRKMASNKWTFGVVTKKPLTHICLLYELHRQYFYISSASLRGTGDKVDLMKGKKADAMIQVLETPSPAALSLGGKKSGLFTYKIDVVFKPDVFGTFRQTILFDFGENLKAIRNLSVDVVPPPEKETDGKEDDGSERPTSPTYDHTSSYRAGVTWNFGNADVVCGFTGEKVSSNKLGFALINGLQKSDSNLATLREPLTTRNYKDKMRFFLTQEERARQEILAKYNVTANLSMTDCYVMTAGFNDGMHKYALDGSLFGRMTLFRDVSEDTAVGRLILRSCNFLLLTKTEEARKADGTTKPRVYLCPISDKTKNAVYTDLGATVVRELGLKKDEVSSFEIQFQLDRTAFMEMKNVIDMLEEFHLDQLFPDFARDYNIPWTPIKQWSLEDLDPKSRLNPRQKEALIAITAENCITPPILVIGPFGTGKTFLLAQCIRKLLTQQNTRIMVCTHSNSAADLYIKEYLDPWYEEGFLEAKPLRIYYELRNLNSVHATVLQHCLIEKLRFRPPTLEEVMAHRVIVVTLSTSYILMKMNLPKDTFSHIILDEAAQAMESEAITPLMTAGLNTRLVLAGDHMQLSPELFSDEARSLQPSLLERLHCSYPDNHPCKLMLCENYRSHSSIIEFVSDAFYTKKLECAMAQPVHSALYPLTFFAARGEEVQDPDSTSYYNMAEVFEVAEKVSELIASWPSKWGSYKNENAIGVLTPYADQVSRIRSQLRKKKLYSVSVERVLNVQGKQFRAVFLSTVRSFRPWVRILPEAVGNEVDLGFFSNPKLLNTALTRAQSLVVVVGDPVSLCSVGKCRSLWKDFIQICHKNNSLHGISFSQLEQNILGVEMRLTWGLNPLANEFEPTAARKSGSSKASAKTGVLYQALKSNNSSAAPSSGQKPAATPIAVASVSQPQQVVTPRPQQQVQVQQRHIPPMPPQQMPFQNPPPIWAPRVPVMPVPQQPGMYNGGYYSGSPIPGQNAMYPPTHNRPVLPVNIPHNPRLPVPGGPPMPFIGQPVVAPRPYLPSGPNHLPSYNSNVMSINGAQFQTVAGFPPLAQVPASNPSAQMSRNVQHGASINNNIFPGPNRHGSPLPVHPGNTSAVNMQKHQPTPNHEQFATGVPLYRRTPNQSSQQAQVQVPTPRSNNTQPHQQQQQQQQQQNLNTNLFGENSQNQQMSFDTDNDFLNLTSNQPNFSREDMQLLNKMLERLATSNECLPGDEQAHMLRSKVRDAASTTSTPAEDWPSSGGGNESYGTGSYNLHGMISSQNQSSNFAPQSNSFNTSNLLSQSELQRNFPIDNSINDIWSSIGLSDNSGRQGAASTREFLANNSSVTASSGYGGFNNTNRSFQSQYNSDFSNMGNISQDGNLSNYGLRQQSLHSDGINPWSNNSREESIFPERQRQQQLGSSFGGLTAQLSGGDSLHGNYQMTNQQQSNKESPESASGGRISYANVVKHAPTTTVGTNIPSEMNNIRGFNPHDDPNVYFQQNVMRLQQQQQQQQQQQHSLFQHMPSSDPNLRKN